MHYFLFQHFLLILHILYPFLTQISFYFRTAFTTPQLSLFQWRGITINRNTLTKFIGNYPFSNAGLRRGSPIAAYFLLLPFVLFTFIQTFLLFYSLLTSSCPFTDFPNILCHGEGLYGSASQALDSRKWPSRQGHADDVDEKSVPDRLTWPQKAVIGLEAWAQSGISLS